MSTHDGKTCAVSFSLQPETATPGTLVWSVLGMMRTKSLKLAWDTADTTADSTPDSAKSAIATRKSVTFSGDGVSYDDAAYNQRMLKAHINLPGSITQNQPKAWIKMAFASGETYIGPYIITSLSVDSPEADAETWSIEATSNGPVAYVSGIVAP